MLLVDNEVKDGALIRKAANGIVKVRIPNQYALIVSNTNKDAIFWRVDECIDSFVMSQKLSRYNFTMKVDKTQLKISKRVPILRKCVNPFQIKLKSHLSEHAIQK